MRKFYANEQFPLPVVIELRRLGHDVVTIQETGKGGQAIPDNEVLKYATADQRILLTFNRKHFIRLHHQNAEHAGIIVCTYDPDFQALAHRIHQALANSSSPSGQLIRINRPNG
ncbi:MAG: DUF5615 family PIN-like protein [Anaerolineales bacterium]|nr:DUF5615 family PIN-like protein [Anaerolineales bacterium]